MEEINAFIFGHKNPDTDSICSSLVKEKYDKNSGYNNKAMRLGEINKETQFVLDYLGINPPELLEEVENGKQVILVDHNEFGQSVKNIENAKILSVVDHHRISNFETSEPLYYLAKPYGCTSTILYEKFVNAGMDIEKTEAVLMLSAIISDTLLLKSPTCTNKDIEVANKLADIADIDLNSYGLDLLKAGTALDDFTASELINLDAKNVSKNGISMVIAQVNTVSIDDVLKRQSEIETAINAQIEKDNLDIFILAITDILNCNSEIIALGSKANVVEKSFNVNLENNKAFLEGVVSRKKQLLPNIDKNI